MAQRTEQLGTTSTGPPSTSRGADRPPDRSASAPPATGHGAHPTRRQRPPPLALISSARASAIPRQRTLSPLSDPSPGGPNGRARTEYSLRRHVFRQVHLLPSSSGHCPPCCGRRRLRQRAAAASASVPPIPNSRDRATRSRRAGGPRWLFPATDQPDRGVPGRAVRPSSLALR